MPIDALTVFGLVSVFGCLICYAMEPRSNLWTLGFAVTCAMASAYGFLQGAWPFGLVEIAWTLVALRRWWMGRAPA
jgi:hypothetical protein